MQSTAILMTFLIIFTFSILLSLFAYQYECKLRKIKKISEKNIANLILQSQVNETDGYLIMWTYYSILNDNDIYKKLVGKGLVKPKSNIKRLKFRGIRKLFQIITDGDTLPPL